MAPANLLSSLFFLALFSVPLVLVDARAVPLSNFSKASNVPNTINNNNNNEEVVIPTTATATTTTTTPTTYNNYYEAATTTTTPNTFYNNYESTTTTPTSDDSNKYYHQEAATTTPTNDNTNKHYHEADVITTAPAGNRYNDNYYKGAVYTTARSNNNNQQFRSGEQYTEEQQATQEPVSRNTAYSVEFRPGTTTTSAANKYSQNNNVQTEALYSYNTGNQLGNQQFKRGQGMSDTRTLEGGKFHYSLAEEGRYPANEQFGNYPPNNNVHTEALYSYNYGDQQKQQSERGEGMSDTRTLEGGKYQYTSAGQGQFHTDSRFGNYSPNDQSEASWENDFQP